LAENLIKTDDRFKSVESTAGYIKKIKDEMNDLNKESD